MPLTGLSPSSCSWLQRGPFEGNGVLLNKANIHLTGSSMGCKLVLAGASTALSPSFLLPPPLSFLPPALPPLCGVFLFQLEGVCWAEVQKAWELGEECEASLGPTWEDSGKRTGPSEKPMEHRSKQERDRGFWKE